MNVEVNWVAIALATVASMVVGSVWYAPSVFGNKWMDWAKLDRKKIEKNGWTPILIAILASLVTAYVLAHVTYLSNKFFGNSYMMDALSTAFWVWLGFTAVRFWTHDSFEGRPLKLTVLNAAHELVTFVAMGAVIGWLGV